MGNSAIRQTPRPLVKSSNFGEWTRSVQWPCLKATVCWRVGGSWRGDKDSIVEVGKGLKKNDSGLFQSRWKMEVGGSTFGHIFSYYIFNSFDSIHLVGYLSATYLPSSRSNESPEFFEASPTAIRHPTRKIPGSGALRARKDEWSSVPKGSLQEALSSW